MNHIKYFILESFFKLRHNTFESFSTGYLKYLLKKYFSKTLQNIFFYKKKRLLNIFPENILIEITSICNAKCWFCPQPTMIRKNSYMKFDLYKKLIHEIKDNMKYVKNIALFMDGEPTLHKDLLDFIIYAKEHSVNNLYLSSNMEYFTPKLTDKIFSSDLGDTLLYVICSLDGASPDIHRQNRINVNYEKAVENTEYLIDAKKRNKANYPWIFTRMLENELTQSQAEQFINMWKNKADKVLISKMHNWGGQIDDERILDIDNTFLKSSCYLPFSQLVIQFDGTTRLCCADTNGTSITGDLNKQSINEVWKGKIFNKYREGQLNQDYSILPSICKNCTYPTKGSWNEPFYWK